TIRGLLSMVKRMPSSLSRVVWDAEFWRGLWVTWAVSDFLKAAGVTSLNLTLPYEQQPWQLRLIYELRRIFGERVRILGDVHSSITNFPVQFSRMNIAPDALVV